MERLMERAMTGQWFTQRQRGWDTLRLARVLSLLLVATLLSAACSSERDFQPVDGRWTYRGTVIPDADGATFRVLDAHHARDARHVWWADTERKGEEYYLIAHVVLRPIEGADAASFAVLAPGYGRDVHAVYHEGRRFAVADPASFEVLEHGFARDARQAYHLRRPIAGSQGGAAFRVLDSQYADDGQRIFHATSDGGRSTVRELRGIDRTRFEVLGAGWARDARTLLHGGERRAGDPASFTPLDRGYVKTSAQVYFLGQPVAGADAGTFEMLQPASETDADARDRRQRYRRGERWKEPARD